MATKMVTPVMPHPTRKERQLKLYRLAADALGKGHVTHRQADVLLRKIETVVDAELVRQEKLSNRVKNHA